MPTVSFRGETVKCDEGAILRDVLREADLTPDNGSGHTPHFRHL